MYMYMTYVYIISKNDIIVCYHVVAMYYTCIYWMLYTGL